MATRLLPLMPNRLLKASFWVLLGALCASGCAEDPVPNHVPEFVAGSASLSCEDIGESNLGPVLAGGSVQVIDENLTAVTLDLGGLATIPLTGPGEAEVVDDEPQTWTFTVDTSQRLACVPALVLVFSAHDEKGDSATMSVAAQ